MRAPKRCPTLHPYITTDKLLLCTSAFRSITSNLLQFEWLLLLLILMIAVVSFFMILLRKKKNSWIIIIFLLSTIGRRITHSSSLPSSSNNHQQPSVQQAAWHPYATFAGLHSRTRSVQGPKADMGAHCHFNLLVLCAMSVTLALWRLYYDYLLSRSSCVTGYQWQGLNKKYCSGLIRWRCRKAL